MTIEYQVVDAPQPEVDPWDEVVQAFLALPEGKELRVKMPKGDGRVKKLSARLSGAAYDCEPQCSMLSRREGDYVFYAKTLRK